MNLISRYILGLRASVLCSVLSSAAVLISIAGDDRPNNFAVKILSPLLFWGGLIAEQILIWKSNKSRKAIESSQKGRKMQGLPGIFSFFKTKAGFAADVIFIFSVLIYLVLAVCNTGVKYAQYIFIFLTVLTFRLHCILNGKNFRYKNNLVKRKVLNDA